MIAAALVVRTRSPRGTTDARARGMSGLLATTCALALGSALLLEPALALAQPPRSPDPGAPREGASAPREGASAPREGASAPREDPSAPREDPSTPREGASAPRGMRGPQRAFELTASSGYAQGFGTLQPGLAVPRVAKAGVGIDVAAGYRIEPHYAVSFGGQYQELSAERDDGVRAFAWNLALQYHIAPTARLDPWVELGAGYRLLWLVPFGTAPNTSFHGPELVRLRAGLDVRVSPGVAFSPVIGADATMFVLRDDTRLSTIADPTLSTFVYAGLQGRIDVGQMK